MTINSDGSVVGSHSAGWLGQIDPHTQSWSKRARWGFGLMAAIPVALLGAVALLAGADAALPGHQWLSDSVALLLYTHFAAQFLVLAFYGKLLIEQDRISSREKIVWVVLFLTLAPVGVMTYWLIHVMNEPQHQGRVVVRDVTPIPHTPYRLADSLR